MKKLGFIFYGEKPDSDTEQKTKEVSTLLCHLFFYILDFIFEYCGIVRFKVKTQSSLLKFFNKHFFVALF